MNPATGTSLNSRTVLAGLAICAAGLLLRVIGLDFGLPFIYDPDEPDFVGRAWQMVTTGDLNPRWFGHPGTPVIYAFAAVFKGYSAAAFPDLAAASTAFLTEPSRFYLLARVVVVLLAGGTLVLTWQLARRVVGTKAGESAALLAPALLALSPLHVQYSRLARPDLLMSFLVLASVLCAVRMAREGRWRDYLGAGFLLGLAIATKFPALVAAPVLVLAHALQQLDQGRPVWARVERLFGAAGATVAGALAGSPFMFVEWRLVIENVVKEARPYHLGGTSDGFLSTLWWYLDGTLLASLGVVALLLAALGAWRALATGLSREGRRSAGPAGLLVLAFPLLFIPFIASLSLRWDRWLLPALPFLCVLAALGFREVATLLHSPAMGPALGRVLARLLSVAVALVAISLPAVDAVLWTRAVAQPDTRTLAYDWLLENVPADSRVLAEAYSPQLPADRFRLYGVNQGYIDRLDGGRRQYPVPTGVIGTLRNPSLVQQAGIDYVLLADHYDRRLAEPGRYARQIAVYEELLSTAELVYQAEPSRGHAAGLTVRVLKVRR